MTCKPSTFRSIQTDVVVGQIHVQRINPNRGHVTPNTSLRRIDRARSGMVRRRTRSSNGVRLPAGWFVVTWHVRHLLSYSAVLIARCSDGDRGRSRSRTRRRFRCRTGCEPSLHPASVPTRRCQAVSWNSSEGLTLIALFDRYGLGRGARGVDDGLVRKPTSTARIWLPPGP